MNDYRKAIIASVIGLIAITLLTACTVEDSCSAYFSEHEYCVGDDCVCGPACTRQSCAEGNVCVSYLYEPTHGVCVPESYRAEHELEALGDS